MTPRVRALIGIVTSIVFIGLGISLWTEEQPLVGGVLVALGVLRAGVAAMQVRNAFFPPDDDRPDDDDGQPPLGQGPT